jgi:Tol biopolymer transport system component
MPLRGADVRLTGILCAAALVAACGTEPSSSPPPFAGKIVFASDRARLDGTPLLYSMNIDGSGLTPLGIPLQGPLGLPDVSPDGRRVMFTRDGVFISDANGLTLDHVLTVQEGVGGRFDPTGKKMVFARSGTDGADLAILDLQTHEVRTLTNTPGFNESLADWSPDGQWVCYTRGPSDDSSPEQVWVIRSDGSSATQLTFDPDQFAGLPAFSSNGDWIAYSKAQTDLRLMRADGSEDHSIFKAPDLAVLSPAWSPGDSLIAFGYGFSIATIRPDGSDLRILADSGVSVAPTWGPALK